MDKISMYKKDILNILKSINIRLKNIEIYFTDYKDYIEYIIMLYEPIKRIKEAFYLLSEKYDNIYMKNESPEYTIHDTYIYNESSEYTIFIKINKEN